MRPGGRPPLVVTVVAGVAVALFVVPLVGLALRADWSQLATDLTRPAPRRALRLSLVSSSAATALTVVLGLPLAWALARADLPGRGVVRAVVLLPMVLPPVVGGMALLAAFDVDGPVGGLLHDALGLELPGSLAGVVLAQTFVAMPFFVVTVESALRTVDPRYEQAAAGLGASPTTVLRRVTLPLAGPSVAAGAVLAWARALGEFGATVTFAGNVGRTRTLPLAIGLGLEADPDAAVALSLVLVAVSLVVLVGLRGRWAVRP